MIGILTLYWRR